MSRRVDHVASRLLPTPAIRCVTQQTFYRLRHGPRSALHGGHDFRPSTAIRDIATKRDWPSLRTRIRATAGVPSWPERVPWKGWLVEEPEMLRELAYYVAMHLPSPDPSKGERSTREQIELTVRRVGWETIRVKGFGLDDQYVRDMGVD
jgi:hypothetical protein